MLQAKEVQDTLACMYQDVTRPSNVRIILLLILAKINNAASNNDKLQNKFEAAMTPADLLSSSNLCTALKPLLYTQVAMIQGHRSSSCHSPNRQ